MTESPTMHRLQLGATLRRWRESAGVSREDAARELECSVSKVTKMEIGSAAPTVLEVKALSRLYQVPDSETDGLLELTRQARKREPVRVPDWMRAAYGLEREAVEIKDFQIDLIPSLFQTEAYARAVASVAHPPRPVAEVERLVTLRMERQARLTSDQPPTLSAVIHESALHTRVGGAEVMRKQLARLVELSELPNVTLRVLPFEVGAHPASGSSFMILRMPSDERVVYLEDLWSADYVKGQQQIDAYSVVYDVLTSAALDEQGSVAVIERVIGELR